MFTLTFTDGKSKTVVSAARYDFAEFRGGQAASVTVNKDYFNDSGVDFRLGYKDPESASDMHATCFVTNEAGKTIDKLGPYPPLPSAPAH